MQVLVVEFVTNASDAMLLPNLVQVTESISGSVVPLAMFHLVFFSVRLFFALQVAARSTQTEAAAFVLRCTPPAPTSEYKTTQANSIRLKFNQNLNNISNFKAHR